jgi:hypothetical protein
MEFAGHIGHHAYFGDYACLGYNGYLGCQVYLVNHVGESSVMTSPLSHTGSIHTAHEKFIGHRQL